MPIGPTGPYAYGKLGRPVASQFGPEAIGARFKARAGPAHSHLEPRGRRTSSGAARSGQTRLGFTPRRSAIEQVE